MPKATCSVEGCERPRHARGFCTLCYARARRTGELILPITHGTVNGYSNAGCRCTDCRLAMSVHYKAKYDADPEKFRAISRSWSASHPDLVAERSKDYRQRNAASESARRRRYYAANRTAAIAAAVEWGRANPELRKRTSRKYKQSNPERIRADVETRRARKASVDTRRFTAADWTRLCARHDLCCVYCGERTSLTQDHIIPISRGGRHAEGNIVPACQPCNSSKGSKLLIEWRSLRAVQLTA